MTPIDLDEQDQRLRLEADDLLARFGILTILNGFGQAHINGSYKLGLMTWRDLDIYIEMQQVDTELFLQLGQ